MSFNTFEGINVKDTRGYRRAVRVIVERENKILLGKRYIGENKKLIYLFPGGGIEDDEGVHEAAVKEVKEEVGLAVDNVRLIGHESRYDKVHEKPERAKLYRGSHDIWVCAKYDGKDTSELGSQGDSFPYMWLTLPEVVKVFKSLEQDFSIKDKLVALDVYTTFLKKASLESYVSVTPFKPVSLPSW